MGRKSSATKDKGKGVMRDTTPPPRPKRQRTSIRIEEPQEQPRPQPQPQRQPSHPPTREMWELLNLESRTRGRNLRTREFLETKTIDFGALEKLGIKQEIMGYLETLSWTGFVKPPYPGYKNLTLEFLSSLDVCKTSRDEVGYYGVRCQLFGKPFQMTRERFASCFGFSNEGIMSFHEANMDMKEFWEEIGTTPRFRPSHTQAKHIGSLGHFVLHKIICNSVFAKKDGNDKVSQKELLFMFCALKEKKVQTAFFFLDHLLHLQASKSGAIMVGSYVSKLAAFLKFDLERPQAYPLSSALSLAIGLMDMEFFVKKVGIVIQEGDVFRYLGGLPEEELRRFHEERRKAQEEERARPMEAQPLDSSTAALLQELLESNKRIEAKLDRIESTLAKQEIDLDYLHTDVIEIREKLNMDPCSHGTSSSSSSESPDF